MTFIPLIVISFVFFNMFHKDQFHKKIQTFQPLIIIYHQFYEPLLFSKSSDDKKNETAHSLTGRLILIQKELSTLLIKYNPEIKDILIGHGMGVHSMGTKHLVKDYDQIYKFENSFTILIYEIGVIGFIFVILFIFYFISFFRRELTNLSEENKKKFLNLF